MTIATGIGIRSSTLRRVVLVICAASSGCSGAGVASSGSGGTSGSGGSGSGGANSTGSGGNGTGGANSTGSGGRTGSGGNASGGATGSGGSSSNGSGGSGSGGASTGGSTGSGGQTGSGGAVGSGGASGGRAGGNSGGSVGTGGAGNDGGSSGNCTITATSTMGTIPTVGIVTYTTDFTGLTAGEIDFGPMGGTTATMMKAPIDTKQTSPKTLLLGMKGGKSYTYRIVLKSAAGSCTSSDYTFMTGAVPSSVVKPTVTISTPTAHDKGFIITSGGLNGTVTEILDADGDVVWWATGPGSNSRSHMSWDGSRMYMMSLNVQNSGTGKIISLGMDGSDSMMASGVAASHHDLTAIPGGFATPMWNKSGMDAPCSLVEFADGTWKTTTVIADMSSVYNSNTFHTNAVHYYASDDTYTVGDRNPNLYVKVSRAGALIWQFGGSNPKDPAKSFSGVTTWMVNHGHHLLADGTFLFFNNNANEAWGYKLNTTSMSATKTFMYTASGATSNVLGDVQGLPNGNVLVTFSTSAQIHEVTSSGSLVMKVTATSSSGYGYAEFRESLYGPPPY